MRTLTIDEQNRRDETTENTQPISCLGRTWKQMSRDLCGNAIVLSSICAVTATVSMMADIALVHVCPSECQQIHPAVETASVIIFETALGLTGASIAIFATASIHFFFKPRRQEPIEHV
jgi:hypothetical protein